MKRGTIVKTPKHILIISLHADPMLPAGIGEYGGGHMYPYELLVGLSNEDFKVSLITRKSDTALPDIDQINGLTTIYRLDYGNIIFHDKRDFYQLKDMSFSLANDLLEQQNIRPDIIHSLYWNSGFLALQLSQKLHIPYVHSPISVGAVIQKRKTKDIEPHRLDTEQIVFENAALIFSITESEKNDIISYYGISKDKIAIIGRPVAKEYLYPIHDEWGNVRNENMQYTPSPIPAEALPMQINENWWEKKAFIYVGRIHHNKGIHHIINAWISLRHQYADACPPLWIVGGTPLEINQFHIDHNLHLDSYEKSGSIIWWGRLNAEGISSLYTRSLALIMHSKYEPGGRVSIEAMSAALPVIATPCGFAVDTITDWHTGFLVQYGDEDKLTDRMSMFILQPYLADSMGYNARNAALHITRKWNFMEHHINVYNRLISSGDLACYAEYNIIENHWIWGIIHSYPASLPKITEDYLRHKFTEAGIHDIVAISNEYSGITEYLVWYIQSKQTTYTALQPCNRINVHRLLDISRYSKIIFAKTVYARFKKWGKYFSSPILVYDDDMMSVIVKQHTVIEYSAENFTDILHFIGNHKRNITLQMQKSLWEIFDRKIGMYDAICRYQSEVEAFAMFAEGDFSVSLEADWIINRINECSHLKNTLSPSLITFLAELKCKYYQPEMVLGGFVEPESLCYCDKELCLLLPVYLHPVEDGYDEGKLLLLTAADNVIPCFWHSLLQRLPVQIQQNALTWAIIFLSKKLLLHQIMSIYPGQAKTIRAQLDLLLNLSSPE